MLKQFLAGSSPQQQSTTADQKKAKGKKKTKSGDDAAASSPEQQEANAAAAVAPASSSSIMDITVAPNVKLIRHFTSKWDEKRVDPKYAYHGNVSQKQRLVDAYLTQAANISEIIIATDPDREGELIGYHALESLMAASAKKKQPGGGGGSAKGGGFPQFSRAYIHSITQEGIMKAMKARQANFYDEGLVEAALTRHHMDRLFGYLGSNVVRRANSSMKSMGRVQTPALIAIRRREEAVQKYNDNFLKMYQLVGEVRFLATDNKTWITRSAGSLVFGQKETSFPEKELADAYLNDKLNWKGFPDGFPSDPNGLLQAPGASERYAEPPLPFSMATLISKANKKLGMTSESVARGLQELFQAGMITYPRTDSTRIDPSFVPNIEAAIAAEFGKEMIGKGVVAAAAAAAPATGEDEKKKDKAPSKKKKEAEKLNVEDAHEAIRPTNMELRDVPGVVSSLNDLYGLIRRTTLAAFMIPKRIKTVRVKAKFPSPTGTEALVAGLSASCVVEPGFTVALRKKGLNDAAAATPLSGGTSGEDALDADDADIADGTDTEEVFALLANLDKKVKTDPKSLVLSSIEVRERRPSPPTLHTEGTLIDELKRYGVGRPSTYPNIVKTLASRGYVNVGHRCSTTGLGQMLVQTTEQAFPKLVDIGFTAEFEKQLDAVSRSGKNGKNAGDLALSAFLNFFLNSVTQATKDIRADVARRMKLVEVKDLSPREVEDALEAAGAEARQKIPCLLAQTARSTGFEPLQTVLQQYLGQYFPSLVMTGTKSVPPPLAGRFQKFEAKDVIATPPPMPGAAATSAKP